MLDHAARFYDGNTSARAGNAQRVEHADHIARAVLRLFSYACILNDFIQYKVTTMS